MSWNADGFWSGTHSLGTLKFIIELVFWLIAKLESRNHDEYFDCWGNLSSNLYHHIIYNIVIRGLLLIGVVSDIYW